jgi:hypothetical protein
MEKVLTLFFLNYSYGTREDYALCFEGTLQVLQNLRDVVWINHVDNSSSSEKIFDIHGIGVQNTVHPHMCGDNTSLKPPYVYRSVHPIYVGTIIYS